MLEPGQDTPTGTDPDAKYEQPGYEDKSFGQAVNADQELAERIADEEPDEARAAERFDAEAAGTPAIARQREDDDLDRDVRSVELEGDDGEPIVISQQNTGPGTMVGQGEHPDPHSPPKSATQAAGEQDDLQRDQPI